MNRRIWIKNITMATGAVLFMPSCLNDKSGKFIDLKYISIDLEDENLMSEICETIIPQTDTLGSKALNLHHFVLKMMDDCYDEINQDKLMKGLAQFNDFSKEKSGSQFSEISKDEKEKLMLKIQNDKLINDDLRYFVQETKSWVIKGYEQSEYVMTKLVPYELVPSRFYGCVPIKK